MSVFSDNLRKIYKSKKLTQETLSEKMDCSRDTVSKWINGERYPDIGQLTRLCEIFDCDPCHLLYENYPEKTASIPLASVSGLSTRATDNLIKAKQDNNPYIDILNDLLENESILLMIAMACTVDFGHVSTFVDIPNIIFDNTGNKKTGISHVHINPKEIRRSYAMETYNSLIKYIDSKRRENGLSGLNEL